MTGHVTTRETHAMMYWPLCWGQDLDNKIEREPSTLAVLACGTLIVCMWLAIVVGVMCSVGG